MLYVSKPKNYYLIENGYFKEKKLDEPQITVKNYKNCFVSHYGNILNRYIIPRFNSIYHYKKPFIQHITRLYTNYFVSHYTKSGKLIRKPNLNYSIIHSPWFNYYHWIVEFVPRYLALEQIKPDVIILIPESYLNFHFVKDTIKYFKIAYEIIPNDYNLDIANLVFPSLKPYCYKYNKKELIKIKEFFLGSFYIKATNKNRRIYVTRQNALRRKILNENEVIIIMQKYKFNICDFDKLQLKEQIKICSEANTLVTLHGAAMTNQIFMTEGSNIFELQKKVTNIYDHHSLVYWTMANALNHNYFFQLCEPENPKDNFFKSNIKVDIDLLEKNLKIMFNE